MLTVAELAAEPDGNPGDKWNKTDISDLRANYPPKVFDNFPGWPKAKITKAKRGTNFPTSQRNVLDIASIQCELSQLRVIMQASIDNSQLSPQPPPTNVFPPSDDNISTTGDRFRRGFS